MKAIGIRAAAYLLSAVMTASLMPVVTASAETIPPDAIGAVSIDAVTTFYYDTKASGGLTAMWNDAVSAKSATVKLFTDWNAANGTRLVEEGKGMAFDGVICVPDGHEVTLDLNGFSINRGLEMSIENGEVICIENGAVLNLTDTKASSGSAGKITGGKNLSGAGGIQIDAGGTLNLWGGCITENVSDKSGGGILLEGESSKLYMTGGSITKNTAAVNGGGIAMVDASLEVVNGSINENKSAGSGGGIYQQGGSAVLQNCQVMSNSAVTGGGICTTAAADLALQSTAAIQNNVAGTAGEQGRGGGILAMGTLPIRLSGTPTVISNRQSDGTISNLTFWINEAGTFVGPRIQNDGVVKGTQVGLNFTGGETERELAFAPTWNMTGVFDGDGEFEYFEADQIQYLKRPLEPRDYMLYVWIGCAAVVLIAAIMIIAIVASVRKKKKHRKRKHSAAKPRK